jgi:hypothetical protein
MRLHRSVLLCLLASACAAGGAGKSASVSGPEVVALGDAAARDCPWPADLARYEQTTLTVRPPQAPAPDLDVLDDAKTGCAVMTFSVDDQGSVAGSDVVSASSPAFAKIAPDILRWNNYAPGASSLTVFMVRLAAQKMPHGGVLLSLGFKDTTIAILVPASAGR